MTEKKNGKGLWIFAGVLYFLFILLIMALRLADVQAIGPNQSKIGLATLNGWFRDLVGVHLALDGITDIGSLTAILTAAFFGVTGLWQLIKGKSFQKIDKELIVLGIFYVIVIVLYLLFEVLVVNCRPILTEGELEASFPSSHTMLAVCLFGTAGYRFYHLLKNVLWRNIAVFATLAVMALTVVLRLLSGVHWLTDICGGILIGNALVLTYIGVCRAMGKPSEV